MNKKIFDIKNVVVISLVAMCINIIILLGFSLIISFFNSNLTTDIVLTSISLIISGFFAGILICKKVKSNYLLNSILVALNIYLFMQIISKIVYANSFSVFSVIKIIILLFSVLLGFFISRR